MDMIASTRRPQAFAESWAPAPAPSRFGDGQIFVRAIDVIGASVLLALFGPVMIIIALLVYASDPGAVVFAQPRLGRGGRFFSCLKFRTMVTDADQRLNDLLASDPRARAEWNRDHKLRDDPRIVGIGRFLRRSSLDELPQLFNVLRGEMSLVGPRPIVEAEAFRYGRYIVAYCSVRPGLTGLWQISGRNNTTYRRRVALDVAYARAASAALNLKILALTIPCVLLARGSY